MTIDTEYTAAQTGAVLVNRNVEGRVRVVGRDRLDLLHRMSTNDTNSLVVGEARQTVLINAIARIVDAPWVLNRGETALMLTGPGRATAVRRWLAGYIFFRDEVKLEDASTELGQFALFGKMAAKIANGLLPGSDSLAENRFLEQDSVIVLRGRPLAGDGFHIIAPAAQFDLLWAQVATAGAVTASEETYQLLRLAAGIPEAGHELTEAYIPLETDLWEAVSFTKGCYIGQEIIARMESRGKLARRLSGLLLAEPVAVGAEVRASGAVVGTVTSAGVLPNIGPAALSVIKTGACEPGTEVTVGDVRGRVVAMPFINQLNG
ncbi:MAG: CAF17-like 4Fe-4S cluster assembly/insertion protein YgfZ [Anaerolineales bacterium]